MVPKCPLCGAVSSWKMFTERPDLNSSIPDECHFCKAEGYAHWKQWQDGIDVTQFGGRPLRSGVDAICKERQEALGEFSFNYQPNDLPD